MVTVSKRGVKGRVRLVIPNWVKRGGRMKDRLSLRGDLREDVGGECGGDKDNLK